MAGACNYAFDFHTFKKFIFISFNCHCQIFHEIIFLTFTFKNHNYKSVWVSVHNQQHITSYKNYRKVYNQDAGDIKHLVSSFCSDYSFWNHTECTGGNYTAARTCKTDGNSFGNETEQSCSEKYQIGIDQFGNKIFEKAFYCKGSNTCIPYSYTCDGAVNCRDAEDESFELCHKFFPEGATIECKEANRTQYNISIYATACDGIMECKDGKDELGCNGNDWTIAFALCCAFMIISFSWSYTYFMVFANLKKDIKEPPEKMVQKYIESETDQIHSKVQQILVRSKSSNYQELRGDDLANFKVCFNFQ